MPPRLKDMLPLIVPALVFCVLFSLCSWRFLGNSVWFLSGGWAALWYYFVGILCCVTVVGIPAGRQLFKLARVSSMPFGLDVSPNPFSTPFNTIANVVWAACFGWELFLGQVFAGVICALTIVGIPFAKQHLKLMTVSLCPFGCVISSAPRI